MNVAILDYVLNNGGAVLAAALVAAYLFAKLKRGRRKTVKVRIVV